MLARVRLIVSILVSFVYISLSAQSAPVISQVTDNTGTTSYLAIGSAAIIAGSGFGDSQATSIVSLNGRAVAAYSWAAGRVGVLIPEDTSPGAVGVQITTPAGASNTVSITVTGRPSITGFTPASGPAGTQITITGSNFGPALVPGLTSISLSGVYSFSQISWSDTQIVATIPAGSLPLSSPFWVFNNGLSGGSSGYFTITPSPQIDGISPTSAAVGSPVTINGSGFANAQMVSQIYIGGVAASVVSWNDTQIVATVPAGAQTGSLYAAVTDAHLNYVNSNSVPFTVLANPVLSGGLSQTVTAVTLTSPTALDWVHWGTSSDNPLVRMAGVTPLISDVTAIGPNAPQIFDVGEVEYIWGDGTPLALGERTTSGYLVFYAGNGFHLSIPADTSVKTLSLYIGAENAQAQLTASLSDNSIAPFVDSSLDSGQGNWLSGTYSIDFRASKPGQTLNIDYVVLKDEGIGPDVVAAVSLASAVLSPHLAVVTLISPNDGQVLAYPSHLTVTAAASQIDTALSKVDFFTDAQNVFELTSAPFSFTSSGLSPGDHVITASATDANGLASTSDPALITELQNGGLLTASISTPIDADLSQGTSDWIHWGNETALNNLDRRAGIAPQISDFSILENGDFTTFDAAGQGGVNYSWSGGTPTDAQAATATQAVMQGFKNGFKLSIPADTTLRTANLYLGYGFGGSKLRASLSDGSAAPFVTVLSANAFDAYEERVVTLQFQAGSSGQQLIITGQVANDLGFAYVDVESATVADQNPPQIDAVTTSEAGPGAAITIMGANFGDGSQGAVTLSGTPLTVNSWTDGSIAATLTGAYTSGPMVVSRGLANSNPIAFIYDGPSITGLSPNTGSPGTQVTITAQNLPPGTVSVSFNGVPASSNLQGNSISTAVPAGVAFGPARVVVQIGTQVTNTLQFNVVPAQGAPLTVAALPSPAPDSAGWNNTPVTVNFVCSGGVLPVTCPAPQAISGEGSNQVVKGFATDSAGNLAEASITLQIDKTPPVVSITALGNNTTVKAGTIRLSGPVSDSLSGVAEVMCNGSIATISTPLFVCNVNLTPGSNSIQVAATDNAGNVASTQVAVTFNAPPPIKAIFLTPALVSLVVGQSQNLRLVGDSGQILSGAQWQIGDTNVAGISTDDPPQLVAVGTGTTILTATLNGLTATMTVNVSAQALAVGTPLWSVSPPPGSAIVQMVSGNPVLPGDPEIFAIGKNNVLQALTADGQQLWVTQVGVSSGSTGASSVPAPVQQTLPVSAPSTSSAAQTLTIPSAGMSGLLEVQPSIGNTTSSRMPKQLAPLTKKQDHASALDYMWEPQQRKLTKMLGQNAPAIKLGISRTAASSTMAINGAASTGGENDFLISTVPDNSGGTVNYLFVVDANGTHNALVRVDNGTQQQTWRYDSPGGLGLDFAISPDNTVYVAETVITGTSPIFGLLPGGLIEIVVAGNPPGHTEVLAFDALTGARKFVLSLPPSHVKITATTLTQGENNPLVDFDQPALVGPLAVMPDGSIQLEFTVNHYFLNAQVDGCLTTCQDTASNDASIQLAVVHPDGSMTPQVIEEFPSAQTNCNKVCDQIQIGTYFPSKVIPDGEGGILAAWGGHDPTIGANATHIHHFNNLGGARDSILPFAPGVAPTTVLRSMVLGQNDVAYANNGLEVISFNVNSGQPQGDFPSTGGTKLLAATEGGGVFVNTFDDVTGLVNSLFQLDSTLTPISYSLNQRFFDATYFNADAMLAPDPAGNAQMPVGPFAYIASFDPWALDGDQDTASIYTKEITIVSWINKDLVPFPPSGSANTALVGALEVPVTCELALAAFRGGNRTLITSDSDRKYANAFLLAFSANHEPPASLPPLWDKGGDFRAFNRTQARIVPIGNQIFSAEFSPGSKTLLGNTPDPCDSLDIAIFDKALKLSKPEKHPDNGKRGVTRNRMHAFQLAEGRVGTEAQTVSRTLNACFSKNNLGLCNSPVPPITPYVWSFPLFDYQGNYTVHTQIFPTYYVYEDGKLVDSTSFLQHPAEEFLKLNAQSQIKADDIK